ncbi:uncharacterized protein LOC120698799 isoform X2 [Panicum virgatum]|uniref:uncharacterized protein LOC120698799 isoform X2 n=1 Tax=Panicum virgatum TaxID=38727 RepID=UPI0019D5441C|nr:uncharacterized protein LOC120698799 isoform X2 [Panicum virgatum]
MPLRAPPRRRLLLHLLLLLAPALADVPDRYSSPRQGASAGAGAGHGNAPAREYLDPTYPTPRPPPSAPSCVVPVLSYSFANTYGAPPATAAYAPPAGCPAPWSLVVLSFSAAVAGDQYDRVAAVWLDGAELLRTTTAEPTPDGIRWTVRKDVTRHSALLRSPPGGVLSVMLENLVNHQYTGVYNVSVSLEFHGVPAYLAGAGSSSSSSGGGAVGSNPSTPTLPESYFQPADLILPISEATGNSIGFWFRIQNSSDSRSKLVSVPSSTYRAVLEVFVSPHQRGGRELQHPRQEEVPRQRVGDVVARQLHDGGGDEAGGDQRGGVHPPGPEQDRPAAGGAGDGGHRPVVGDAEGGGQGGDGGQVPAVAGDGDRGRRRRERHVRDEDEPDALPERRDERRGRGAVRGARGAARRRAGRGGVDAREGPRRAQRVGGDDAGVPVQRRRGAGGAGHRHAGRRRAERQRDGELQRPGRRCDVESSSSIRFQSEPCFQLLQRWRLALLPV